MNTELKFSNDDIQATEFARINADGSCWFDWKKIEELAAQWKPFESGSAICISRLLVAARKLTDERTEAK